MANAAVRAEVDIWTTVNGQRQLEHVGKVREFFLVSVV